MVLPFCSLINTLDLALTSSPVQIQHFGGKLSQDYSSSARSCRNKFKSKQILQEKKWWPQSHQIGTGAWPLSRAPSSEIHQAEPGSPYSNLSPQSTAASASVGLSQASRLGYTCRESRSQGKLGVGRPPPLLAQPRISAGRVEPRLVSWPHATPSGRHGTVIISEPFSVVWGCWFFPEYCPKSGIQKCAAITYNVRWISELTDVLCETQSDSSPFPTGLCILPPPKRHDLWPSLLHLSRLSSRSACNQSFLYSSSGRSSWVAIICLNAQTAL